MYIKEKLIFCVDDDEFYLKVLEKHLGKNKNLSVVTLHTSQLLMDNLDLKPDVVFLDYHLTEDNKINGMHLLTIIKNKSPKTKVYILSSQDNVDIGVECLRKGADDYIIKNKSAFIKCNHLVQKPVKIESFWSNKWLQIAGILIGAILLVLAIIKL